MAATESLDERLERLSTICGALPGVKRETYGSHATFKVARKPFVYYLHNHHGDGVIGVACKVPAGENTALVGGESEAILFASVRRASRVGWVAA